jgi:hypothetical protein
MAARNITAETRNDACFHESKHVEILTAVSNLPNALDDNWLREYPLRDLL